MSIDILYKHSYSLIKRFFLNKIFNTQQFHSNFQKIQSQNFSINLINRTNSHRDSHIPRIYYTFETHFRVIKLVLRPKQTQKKLINTPDRRVERGVGVSNFRLTKARWRVPKYRSPIGRETSPLSKAPSQIATCVCVPCRRMW